MRKYVACLVAMGASCGVAFGEDPSSDARVDELMAKIDQLQSQVAALEATDEEVWMTEQRAEEIRGVVEDVLADADMRASLLQSGATAGWDKKFFLASADGNFRLNIAGQVQVRWIYNRQDAGDDPDIDENRSGFEVRRAKFKFTGHVVDPSWQYAVTGAFGRSGGFSGEDLYVRKKLEGGWAVTLGQFKGPFMREELVSSSRQLTADRSLINERWNQDRSQGVQLSWENDQFRLAGMYSDGIDTANTAALTRDTEWAFMARGELLLSGEWSQFKDFTSWRGSDNAVMIGAAISYQKDEYGTSADDDELEDLRLTADVSLEFDGWNIFGALVWQDQDNDASGAAEIDNSPWGVVVQGGVFLTDDWEVFGRYEWGDDDSSLDDLSVVTIGVNRYWNKHGLKWTTDVGYALDSLESEEFGRHAGVGYRQDAPGEDGQIVIRSQFQLLF
jgi:hypothetical protein